MPTQRTDNLQWVSLQDFSAGIYNRTEHALGGTNAGVAIPAPLGAAQETNTYRCVALPGGGLGPLPKRIETFSLAAPEATAPASGYFVVGFFSHGPMSSGIGGVSRYTDQIFLAVAYQIGAGNQRFRLYRQQIFAAAGPPYTTDTLRSENSAYTGNNFYETCWFMTSRINTTDPTLPGNPVVGIQWQTPDASVAFVSTFPDPSTANVTALLDLSTRQGTIFGHQGRVVLAENVAYSLGAVGGSFTDEQISFTDPPNSTAMGSQNEIFSQENPSGIGAVGSISAGEVFFVKRAGGGVIVSGDLANPSVTRLPGVVSTGSATSNRSASTASGLFYAVKDGGVYVWRGGDTSTKVSGQLEDSSFEVATQAPRNDTSNFTIQPIMCIAEWDNWVLASNNWLYDIQGNGWWKIEDTSSVEIMHWSKSWSGQFMYGAVPTFSQTNLNCFYSWDRHQCATSYSWQSHPIPATIDRLTEVREMVLVAQGSGTVTVTMTGIDPAGVDTTQAETFTVTHASQPQRLRPSVGGTFIKGYNVMARIESSGSDKAPVVYALHLGTRQAQQVVNT